MRPDHSHNRHGPFGKPLTPLAEEGVQWKGITSDYALLLFGVFADAGAVSHSALSAKKREEREVGLAKPELFLVSLLKADPTIHRYTGLPTPTRSSPCTPSGSNL